MKRTKNKRVISRNRDENLCRWFIQSLMRIFRLATRSFRSLKEDETWVLITLRLFRLHSNLLTYIEALCVDRINITILFKKRDLRILSNLNRQSLLYIYCNSIYIVFVPWRAKPKINLIIRQNKLKEIKL